MERLVALTLVLVGLLLGGCRSGPSAQAAVAPVVPPAAEGSRVALVRDAMVESGAVARGPAHSESAQSAVRVWRSAGEGEGEGG